MTIFEKLRPKNKQKHNLCYLFILNSFLLDTTFFRSFMINSIKYRFNFFFFLFLKHLYTRQKLFMKYQRIYKIIKYKLCICLCNIRKGFIDKTNVCYLLRKYVKWLHKNSALLLLSTLDEICLKFSKSTAKKQISKTKWICYYTSMQHFIL